MKKQNPSDYRKTYNDQTNTSIYKLTPNLII